MNRTFFYDLAERALSTYIQVVIGLVIASGVIDITAVKVAGIAAIPATLSVIKSFLAERFKPNAISPASFAPPVTEPPVFN